MSNEQLGAIFNESECLKYDPFCGDFGTPSDRTFKDKIGIARKSGDCGMCRQEIHSGERVRMITALFDESMRTYRWCSYCCAAMASIWTDDFSAMDERMRIADSKDNP